MDQGAQKINDLYNHTPALAEFSRCLDPTFNYIYNWESFAFTLGVPQDVIRRCKLYSEYRPTVRLFKYLEATRPDMTVGDLRNALTRNPQRARHDLDRMLKGMDNELKISEAITNSTTDFMDQMALKLDSASRPTCTWMDVGLELGITHDKLKQFEMYTGYNPTEALFRYLYTASPGVTASVIVGYLKQMNRLDILEDVEETIQSTEIASKDAQDIFKLGSKLLYTTSRKLNEDFPGVKGWRELAQCLISDNYIDYSNIISELEPPHQHEIHSPTKKVIEWLAANKPDVTIVQLIAKCEEINRNDAVKILIGHFSRAVENSYDAPESPMSPPAGNSIQETTATIEHILKDNLRSFGLPKPTTKMIGREKEKANLITDIVQGENRLIVLHAATGFGKETLAVATAYELIEKHDYTCIYVDSDGIITVEDLAIKILTTCGIPAPSFSEKEKVKELFKTITRKCLLILDNFDHAFHSGDKRKMSIDNRTSSLPRDPIACSVPNTSSYTSRSPATVFGGSSFSYPGPSTSGSSVPCEGDIVSLRSRESFDATSQSGFTNGNPSQFPFQKDIGRKEQYQTFIEDLLKYTTSCTILATTWESFSVAINTKEVELPPLTTPESEELLLSRCESVHGMERSSISSDQLQVVLNCCSGIPQLLRNAVVIVKFGFETGAASLASIPLEQQLKLLCPSNMSPKERFQHCLGICFDRLQDNSKKVLMMVSVFPSLFSLNEAEMVFKSIMSNKEELQDGLTDLMTFSFLSYDQDRKAYCWNHSMRSFAIYKATCSTADDDSCNNELSRTYKGAISRFVYYTFDIILKIENDFFSNQSANAIQRYREQVENLREIVRWFISDSLSKDPDMKRLRHHIIQSFIQCYMVNIQLMEANLIKTILCSFSRFCLCNLCKESTKKKGAMNKSTNWDSNNKYFECLTYGGVTCILGCLCVPQLCSIALDEAMWCFIEVLKALKGGSQTFCSLNEQLRVVSKCKIMSEGAQAQFLLKYGECLVRHGRKKEGLNFIQRGIEIRQRVCKKSKSAKDIVMLAVGYNDLASAYSYNNDSNGTAIKVREDNVLPVYRKYLGRHPLTANAFGHLAHDYLALDLHEKALQACKKALSYRESLLGEHSETARSLFDMGRILREQACHCEYPETKDRKYEEALFYLNKALEMRQHLAFTSKETAQTHSEIADVLKSLKREEEVKKHVEKARVYIKMVEISHRN